MNVFHCVLNNTQSENEKSALEEESAVYAKKLCFLKNLYTLKNIFMTTVYVRSYTYKAREMRQSNSLVDTLALLDFISR